MFLKQRNREFVVSETKLKEYKSMKEPQPTEIELTSKRKEKSAAPAKKIVFFIILIIVIVFILAVTIALAHRASLVPESVQSGSFPITESFTEPSR